MNNNNDIKKLINLVVETILSDQIKFRKEISEAFKKIQKEREIQNEKKTREND